jgi:hypothetical protein
MDQPASDFDGAWKTALEQYFAPFLAFFFPSVHADIDWTQDVQSRDPDLQQIAPDDRQGKQHVDKLMQVTRRNGATGYVLIHIEIQSQRDQVFAERMFLYNARIYDRERIPVASLAILGDEAANWRPDHFGYELWGSRIRMQFPVVKLRDLDPVMLASTKNIFATLTLVHRDAQETRQDPAERAQRKVSRFRELLRQGYDSADIRNLLRMMDYLLRLNQDLTEQTRHSLRQIEVEELGMERYVTSFEEIGRAEGQRELVLRQLNRKLGILEPELQERIEALDTDSILELSGALLDFTDIADLTTWLDQHECPSDDSAE